MGGCDGERRQLLEVEKGQSLAWCRADWGETETRSDGKSGPKVKQVDRKIPPAPGLLGSIPSQKLHQPQGQ